MKGREEREDVLMHRKDVLQGYIARIYRKDVLYCNDELQGCIVLNGCVTWWVHK